MPNFRRAESLQRLLLLRLSTLNRNFNVATYFEKFKELTTNLERVNFVYKDMEENYLFPDVSKEGKDDRHSEVCRAEGNEAFRSANYRVALRLYTCSIAMAKSTGLLALAYANRSATWYKMGRYQDCLTDIERALASNYPDNLKPKLITRRTIAEKMLNLSGSLEPYHQETPEIPTFEKHPTITSANKCIKIATNETLGRHVVATRDIEIGETICVEKPYACAVLTDKVIRCHTCLGLCYNPIPCDKCSYLVFCSEDCKNEACNTFHKYECSTIASLLEGRTDSHVLVATRAAALGMQENSFQLSQDQLYRSDRYKEIGNLMSDTEKMKVEVLHQKVVDAACIFHLFLKRTLMFNCQNSDIMKNRFKENLLSQMIIYYWNALPIYESVMDLFEWKDELVACGVYSFASLFGHSCCPNVQSIQYGSTMVLKTINSIKKGKQCCLSYGPTYWNMDRPERSSLLKHDYRFECRCVACVQDWKFDGNFLDFELPFSNMTHVDALIMELELKTCHCEAAWMYLPYLKEQLKICEELEPRGSAIYIKKCIVECYLSFGNKRMP